MIKPSIVAPGGSLEKACVALDYGADAVYVGTNEFSLRKSADNLHINELRYLCNLAKKMGKRIYLAMNIYPHESDILPIISQLKDLSGIGLSALIISDLGLCLLAKEHTTIPIHASTQASILNAYSAKLWQSMGAKRLVLAREASLAESSVIKAATGLETEAFIHGAMCSSFSGKCTISNVASGRDSNRGGCIQSCRHPYELSNGDTIHIMNSKDLMGLDKIPDYFKHRVDAVKIEGRMKSALYVANACQQYRRAIDAYADSPEKFHRLLPELKTNLSRVSNRGFTDASLSTPAGKSSISYEWNGYKNTTQFLGIVHDSSKEKSLISVKQPLKSGDIISHISPKNTAPKALKLAMTSLDGTPLELAIPNQRVWVDGCYPTHSVFIQCI